MTAALTAVDCRNLGLRASLVTGWHSTCSCGWEGPGRQTSASAREDYVVHSDPPPPTGWKIWVSGEPEPKPWSFGDKKAAMEHLGALKSKRVTPGLYQTPAGDFVFRAEQSQEAATVAASREGKQS